MDESLELRVNKKEYSGSLSKMHSILDVLKKPVVKYITIFGAVIALTLPHTGCMMKEEDWYLFDFNSFVLPSISNENISEQEIANVGGFLNLVEESYLPRLSCKWLKNNVEYKKHYGASKSPFELYLDKEGSCTDMSNFTAYMAYCYDIPAWQIEIKCEIPSAKHMISVFKEGGIDGNYYFDGVEKYYSASDNDQYINATSYFDSFEHIVEFNEWLNPKYEGWISFKVFDLNGKLVEECFNQGQKLSEAEKNKRFMDILAKNNIEYWEIEGIRDRLTNLGL